MSTSSRDQWARLYTDPNPLLLGNNPVLEREEVLWDPVALSDLVRRAFPYADWYITQRDMNLSLALGKGRYGAHELITRQKSSSRTGYLWAVLSDVRTIKPTLRSTAGKNAYSDKVTGGLMRDALKTHGRENCQKCYSYDLQYVRTTLKCKRCNTIVGGF